LLKSIRQIGRRAFLYAEGAFNSVFGPDWNPFYQLGALTIFFFWIVLVSGVYELIFFKTSVYGAYASVEYMTRDQWYLAGVMRSFHRYASDAAVITMMLHLVRELTRDRYRGFRWYSWLTGVPLIWLVIPFGITGYWLVWDKLAQYIAISTSELLDALPIFTDPMARNFLTDSSVNDRFFTLMTFTHIIGLPIFLLFAIWFHVLRITRPKVNPPLGLAVGSTLALLALSLVKPALSHAPAQLATVPQQLQLDWFYLNLYPLLDLWTPKTVWAVLGGVTLLLALLPWLPRKRKEPVAEVDLANCNGCRRCFEDCPYSAITMVPRTDGRKFKDQPVVDPDLCASCGICAGACPSSTPFRSVEQLATGIDMPQFSVHALRQATTAAIEGLAGESRVLVYGCDHGADVTALRSSGIAALSLPCISALPPSFIEYALQELGADGVMVTGCGMGDCHYRLGNLWMEQRIRGEREPHLRPHVDRERIRVSWASRTNAQALARELEEFRRNLRPRPASDKRVAAESRARTAKLKRVAGHG
jgi:coenzyme F420-reducing hydrogenase delta subunit/quinol-cytochrome oxidoreductase complex cytochrome b subunit